MATILCLRFNNAYNRILKRYEETSDYADYVIDEFDNINFNPNDGVNTELVIGNELTDIPDYLLELEYYGKINSRWYVLEAVRLRGGQYNLSLYRDLLADYIEEIQNAPLFVEKGPLPASSPLLFNEENITFNQIREEPTLLKDKTNIPWIVGYIPRDAFQENTQIVADMDQSASADIVVDDISDWEYAKYINNSHIYHNMKAGTTIRLIKQVKLVNYYYEGSFGRVGNIGYTANINGKFDGTWKYHLLSQAQGTIWDTQIAQYLYTMKNNALYTSYMDGLTVSRYDPISDVELSILLGLNGKIIKDDNEIYKIKCYVEPYSYSYSLKDETSMISELMANLPSYGLESGGITKNTFTAEFEGQKVYFSLEQLQTKAFVNIDADRFHLEDEPYDMFCIPYGDIKIKQGNGYFNATNPGAAIACQIAATAGANSIYDVQVLPYCPVQYLINGDGELDITTAKTDRIYAAEGKSISELIWCRFSSFSFEIPFEIPMPTDAETIKLLSQTRAYRLVAPNYGSIFEFNPYKNGGVDYFRVDCSYKPYNPYMRVAPIFKGLYGYGGQYDSRGLILNGDYSLPQLSNEWANYQLQNKNYQAIFDRQMKSIDITNKYSFWGETIAAGAGATQGAISGAMGGAMIGGMAGSAGGPWGAAIGAAVGGTVGGGLSMGGGIADVFIQNQMRKENRSLQVDLYGYGLGNIQAIPTALAKTSALNINNSLVPMLEIYSCSEVETEAFRNKLRYNGFTVMAIGTLAEYQTYKNYDYDFFKAQLIRLEGLDDDTHVAQAIALELSEGVFI